jgi:hypothetical protein
MYAETGVAAILLYSGLSLSTAGLATGAVMLIAGAAAYYFGRQHQPRFALPDVKWFEWMTGFFIAEAVLFALWQLTRSRHTSTRRFNTGPAGRERFMEGSTGRSIRIRLPSWKRRKEIAAIRCWLSSGVPYRRS